MSTHAHNPTFWKRKLAAYLHDPPEKVYDFGEHHHNRARIHAESFGVAGLWESLTRHPDWSAAAADRFIFPSGQKLGENIGDRTCPCFVHPLLGRGTSAPHYCSLPSAEISYPPQEDAETWLSHIRPDWQSEDPQILFLRVWRYWSWHAAAHHRGEGRGAELLHYLPADTRAPDATIWHHCAIVSAFEATRPGDDPKVPLKPAFLVFQVGPVQEFIAQARSTRDLWSGSYLLSWLTMHAIKAVADKYGPDAIIFPSLKGQPLYDFLEHRLGHSPHENEVLVPCIPNRFLALVPEDIDVTAVETAFRTEWDLIAKECLQWLKERELPFDSAHETRYWQQVKHHWHISWQLWPWQNVTDTLAAFKLLPMGRNNPIHLAKIIAEAIPAIHRDERCYRGGQLDPGWAWSAHYHLCQHALDARRAVRDFHGLQTDPRHKPGHRDALSGREEAVVQADALEKTIRKNDELRHFFRHLEPLGAANLIKRVWHKAYLARLNEVNGKGHLSPLKRARTAFDSVPSVAAGEWIEELRKRLNTEQELWQGVIDLSGKLASVSGLLHGMSVPRPIDPNTSQKESTWLEEVEPELFTDRFWANPDNFEPGAAGAPETKRAAAAVSEFKNRFKLGEPPSYYAVLAFDGDQIGKWLSGEKSPAVESVISPGAAAYFAEKMLSAMTEQERAEFAKRLQHANLDLRKPKGWESHWPPASPEDWIKAWLASPRPISPSWHLQFSEALANFSLYAARRIVEEVHHGQLIYSGGDDVLAMLPAENAIVCATDLRAAFQGRYADMSPECKKLFREEAPEGFLWLASPKKGEPTWPLLVPGPRITVSVGLAIGHVREPLQDMVAEAQAAEKRAKAPPLVNHFDRNQNAMSWVSNEGWGRNALAVTLFKRSGEIVHWGARFDSNAFSLLQYFQAHYRNGNGNQGTPAPISHRFPYRLAELLSKYGAKNQIGEKLWDVAMREIEFVIDRHTISEKEAQLAGLKFSRSELYNYCKKYLADLRNFTWEPAPGEPPVPAPRPLSEFINLFLVEAFISRQLDES